jgi:hypothetical protein
MASHARLPSMIAAAARNCRCFVIACRETRKLSESAEIEAYARLGSNGVGQAFSPASRRSTRRRGVG